MIHTFTAQFTINGIAQKNEMTYSDDDIKTTLARRLRTAFANALDITIERKPEEQITLIDGAKKR